MFVGDVLVPSEYSNLCVVMRYPAKLPSNALQT